MRNYYSRDPYRSMARFNGTCPDCNERISKGDEITVWPTSRKGRRARHWRCSETDYLRFEAAAEDEYFMTGGVQ